MEFSDVIKYQTSVRDYSDKEVEDEKITYTLECACLAPFYMNMQSWRFIVIKNKETISLIAKTSLINRWLKTAPLLIIACADPTVNDTQKNREYYIIDASIALEYLILAATDIGLGTCWIGEFNEEAVKKLL
jgi:nitroreductase